MFPVHRPHGVWFTVHIRRCRGHPVWTSVSATCFLHLTVPHLADTCAEWMRKGKPLISAMYCRPEFGSLVGGGTSQSLGTQLRVAVLHNCKVLCNFHCIILFLLYISIRVCIFVTRVTKHSSQMFNINTRNNHKGIFSCNRWWCVGAM